MARTLKLACGGKGPCCHVGYSHRHCEHCDMVIDTRPASWSYTPYLPIVVQQPPRPYWTNAANGIYSNFGDIANAASALSVDYLATSQASAALAEHACIDIQAGG